MTLRRTFPLFARQPRLLLQAAAWCSVALLVSGIALGATIKGQVKGHNRLINPVWEEAAKPDSHRYTWREPSPTVRAEFRQLFGLAPKELCIAAIRKDAVQPSSVPILITIGGSRTTPVTIVIAPGTRLQFRNNDPFKHRLFAVNEGSLTPADMAIAATRDWTPPAPGVYELRDELAPSLRSWVVVKPNVASIGYPDRGGLFSMKLEPGEYTLEAYFAGQQIGQRREITVTTADIDLTREPITVASEKASKDAK